MMAYEYLSNCPISLRFAARRLLLAAAMLVIISDLHLTDGTSGSTISPGAFQLLGERIADLTMGASQLIFVYVIVQAYRGKGEKAPANPWDGAEGLEWTLPSPAPYHSFETPPIVK